MGDYVSPFATAFPDVPEIEGVELYTFHSGVKYARDDVLLALLPEGTSIAGMFTSNSMPGAPVEWTRERVKTGKARAIIVNSGNANVFTGSAGDALIRATVSKVAELASCAIDEVMVGSTGVIGEVLDADIIVRAIDIDGKEHASWEDAARAISTTDTFPKGVHRRVNIGGQDVDIVGIIKGSGMIAPDMATMLGYIFISAQVPATLLHEMLRTCVGKSYNTITVDSDTSTSDMVLACAVGGVEINSLTDDAGKSLAQAFTEVNQELAQLVVRDGEGITKLIEVRVKGAESDDSARIVALGIANSPLVKTAVAGEDPNWGRIVMAVGKSGQKANRDGTNIWIGDTHIAKDGMLHSEYREEDAAQYMKGSRIKITVDIAVGTGSATVYGCDLTHEYIRINADYRS